MKPIVDSQLVVLCWLCNQEPSCWMRPTQVLAEVRVNIATVLAGLYAKGLVERRARSFPYAHDLTPRYEYRASAQGRKLVMGESVG